MRTVSIIRVSISIAIVSLGVLLVTVDRAAAEGKNGPSKAKKFRGVIGAKSQKIKREGSKTLLWAGSPSGDPNSSDSQWYDFTGSSIPAGDLQFGIGKDRIRAIDDPLFVSPDDPRLLRLPFSHYRKDDKPETNNDIRVIGYIAEGKARAYPVALLDRHELVNDTFGGKPVTVGW